MNLCFVVVYVLALLAKASAEVTHDVEYNLSASSNKSDLGLKQRRFEDDNQQLETSTSDAFSNDELCRSLEENDKDARERI